MMRYKNKVILALVLIFFCVAAAMIYRINQIFPNPDNIPVNVGEPFTYKGLSVTAGEVEIYYDKELFEAYPDLEASLNPLYNAAEEVSSRTHYILVNLKMKNSTNRKISLGKESVTSWVVETDDDTNGTDFQYFMAFNPDYVSSISAGEEVEVKLPFGILEDYLTQEELEQSDIKIVYSYYPTKNYIFYPAGEREIQQ